MVPVQRRYTFGDNSVSYFCGERSLVGTVTTGNQRALSSSPAITSPSMRFTISNQTHDNLLCQYGKKPKEEHFLLVPPFSNSARFSPKCTSLWFSGCSQDVSFKGLIAFTENTSAVAIKLTMAAGRKWERVIVHSDSPWVVYRNRVGSIVHTNYPGLC